VSWDTLRAENSAEVLKKSGEVSKHIVTLRAFGFGPSPDRCPQRLNFVEPGEFVTRALRSNSLWLVVTYVGLILLMARVYA
jgi:hypothetical protein